MNLCNEITLVKFLDNELTENERIAFEQHVKTCEKCAKLYLEISGVDKLLNGVQRTQAPASIYQAYKKELDSLFAPESWWHKISADLTYLFSAPKPFYFRLAQAAVLLIIGIFLGRFSMKPAEFNGPPYQVNYSHHSTGYDVEFIENYFSKTEFLLLAIKNSNSSQLTVSDWNMNKEIAENLLAQKEIIDQAGIGQGHDVVDYLNQLEMILLEISNREPEQIAQTFSVLKDIVREANLVQTTRQIQKRVSKKNTHV